MIERPTVLIAVSQLRGPRHERRPGRHGEVIQRGDHFCPLSLFRRGDRHDCCETLRQHISEACHDLGPRLPSRLGLRQAGGPPGGLPRKG